MRLLVLVLILVAGRSAASAQEARLVIREAVTPWGTETLASDTTGWEPSKLDGQRILLGSVLLDLGPGSVDSVSVEVDPSTLSPQAFLVFAEASRAAFAQITEDRIGRSLAIVFDGRVLTAPTIQSAIPHGRLVITGAFTRGEVEKLVAALQSATGAARRKR